MAREGDSVTIVIDEHTTIRIAEDWGSSALSTGAFYEEHAQEYFDRTVIADLSHLYEKFFKYLRPGAKILDLGSGSGRDLKMMHDSGYDPLGIDASPILARLAERFSGVSCLAMRFEDLKFVVKFDAAWACASLLHLPKVMLPSILTLIGNTLFKDGVLFVSVRMGQGEQLLEDGRFFAYYTLEEMSQFIANAGFSIVESWVSKDTLDPLRSIEWVNVIGLRNDRKF